MNPNKLFFPAVILVSGLLVGLISLVSSPQVTLASAPVDLPAQEIVVLHTTVISSKYPESVRRWDSLIREKAQKFNIDPNLIAALILQESGGDSSAYSSSGAVGLMQIMPRDGIASSFTCGDHPCFQNRPSMQELYDPEFNIEYGIRFLAGLINKHGSIREALYHYGPYDVGYRYADIVLNIYRTY